MRSDLVDILGQMVRLVAVAQARLSRYVAVVDAARVMYDGNYDCLEGRVLVEKPLYFALGAALDALDKEG